MEVKEQQADASSSARGKRAKQLRNALRYSRRAFAVKHDLKAATIQNWEDARYGGMTERGSHLLAEAYQREGLDCRPEWLFYGLGDDPLEKARLLIPGLNPDPAGAKSDSIQIQIMRELQLFQSHHKNVVDAIVADDALYPFLREGDHVAGERFFNADFPQLLGHPCIVQTASGDVMVRVLQAGSQEGRFHLHATNPNAAVASQVAENIEVFSAAPILWVRRKSNFSGNGEA